MESECQGGIEIGVRTIWKRPSLFLAVLNYLFSQFLFQYKTCKEGCCEHEYCAFDRICYPKSKCRFGCPDGVCEEGACIPSVPCENSYVCDIGHTCTMNYNLGYNTCQYDLDIGSSLCMRRKREYSDLMRRRLLAKYAQP